MLSQQLSRFIRTVPRHGTILPRSEDQRKVPGDGDQVRNTGLRIVSSLYIRLSKEILYCGTIRCSCIAALRFNRMPPGE